MDATEGRRHAVESRPRGQLSAVGLTLLIGLVLVGATAVVLLGGSALTDARSAAQTDRADHAMRQFDGRASRVALGHERRLTTTLPGDEAVTVSEDAGWMRVTVTNAATGAEREVVNTTLGAVTYATPETTVGYQGGGVWADPAGAGEASMLSSPEFHYRGGTLTLPVVTVTAADRTASGRVQLRQGTTGVRAFPDPSRNLTNPLTDAAVAVTVHSRFYEAWAWYFEQRTDGEATVDHANRTATIRLVTPTDDPVVRGAIVSGATGATIDIDNGGFVDSYNSSQGTYDETKRGNGDVIVADTLKLNSGGATVEGNVTAGGDVILDTSSVRIEGHVFCGAGNHDCVTTNAGTITGSVHNTSEAVPIPDPVGDTVETKIRTLRSENDNNETANVSGQQLAVAEDEDATLPAGRYFLDSLDREGDLVLNTSGGDVVLAVDGRIDLDGANVTVVGNGTVRVYADLTDADLVLDNGARVQTLNESGGRTHDATRFWLYAPPGIDADLDSESSFTGVLYAPDTPTASGQVDIAGSEVFGAVVAHVKSMDEGNQVGQVHFDEALLDERALARGNPEAPRISFLQVSTNEVVVTQG